MKQICPQGIAPAKKMGCVPWDTLLFLQRWDAVGRSGVIRWVLGALPPNTCTRRCQVNSPVLAGAAPVHIKNSSATPGPAPSKGNLPGLDIRPWSEITY